MADKYALLTKYLTEQMTDFQSNVPGEGGSPEAIAYTAHGLAKAIIDALPASELRIIGDASCEQLNAMEKNGGELAVVTDNGTLQGSVPLIVSRGCVVYFDGEKFVKVYGGGDSIVVDNALNTVSANPIANAPVAQAISDLNKRIDELEPGENVQSDWSQDDDTSPDFIKNKPEIPAAITVDSALSPTSVNPVQNRVLKDALDGKQFFSMSRQEISSALSHINATNYLRCSFFFESTKGIGTHSAGDSIVLILYDVSSFTNDGLTSSEDCCLFRGIASLGYVAGYGFQSISNIVAGVHYSSSTRELYTNDNLVFPQIVTAKYDDADNGIVTGHRYLSIVIERNKKSWNNKEYLIEGVFVNRFSNDNYSHKRFIGINYWYKNSSETYWDVYAGDKTFIGYVSTANKLFTPRAIRTNLGSTSEGLFDGSSNVTPGVTGTLAVTHGGTGATTASAARNNLDVYSKSEVSQSITNEATERQQADGELQAQIDAISSKSDVVDVVASYVELVAYDTSALGDNDVIKVLEDETHDDAESYYRWNLTTETWGYIGSQGPFVTPAEMQTALGGKQNVNGTNATSAGMSTAINKLDVGSEDFLDSDYIICSGHNSGSTSTSEFVKRAFTKLYNRIKTKFDRVYASLQDISGKADNTPTFSQASTRANLAGSGETMPTILGKIKKWFADLNTVAFSGSYNDLSGKPTIPAAANDATLTVKMNGSTKGTFTANASADEEIDLGTVITDVSEKIEVAWKSFDRMRDMTASQRAKVYEEIVNLMEQTYNGGAKVLPCIESGQGCIQFPYEGVGGIDHIYFAGIFGWHDPDDLIIQTTSLYSDGRYEEYMHHIATTENFPTASTSTPLIDGVASAGTETEYARGNHRHPTDTSRQAALPTSGTASSTYAINISGNANTANNASGKNFVVNGKGQETSITVRYNDSTPPILLDATSSKRGLWASVSGSYAGKWVIEVDSTNEATLNSSKIKCSSVSAVFGTEKNLNNMVCNEGEIVNVYEYGESASSGYSNRPVSSASSFRLEVSSTRASSSIYNFKQIFFNGKDGKVYSRYTTGTTLSAAKSNWSAWAAGI